MGRLDEKVAFVAGGAGGVGEGLVKSLMEEGATVIVPSRSSAKLDTLRQYMEKVESGQLLTLEGNIGDEEGVREIQHRVYNEMTHNLDVVIASVGGWWQGLPLTGVDLSEWHRIIQNNMTTHFLLAKHFLPLLNPRTGVYIHINGDAAETPYPRSGLSSITAAAMKMMALTLAEELKPTGIRVHEIIMGPVNTRNRIRNSGFNDDWYTPQEIGRHLIDLVTKEAPGSEEVLHHLLGKE